MLQEQTVVNKQIKDLISLLVLDCTKFYSDGKTLKHTAAFRQIIKKGKKVCLFPICNIKLRT